MTTDPKPNYDALRAELESQANVLRHRLDAIQRDRTMKKGPLSADWQEQATELENEEVLAELQISQGHTLEAIEAAITRIDEGTYGICVECGDPIAPRRLEALPFSTQCITCAREREQKD